MSGQLFGHGHLRLVLLQSLADGPRHGYDIIQSVSEQFGGSYRPSAGSVYPRLGRLVDDGLLSTRPDGRKRVYELTDAGRRELAERASELAQISDHIDDSVQRLALDVRARAAESLRSLRTELSAPRGSDAASVPVGNDQRIMLAEAELAIAATSTRLRVELARAAARGELTAERVRALAQALEDIRL